MTFKHLGINEPRNVTDHQGGGGGRKAILLQSCCTSCCPIIGNCNGVTENGETEINMQLGLLNNFE